MPDTTTPTDTLTVVEVATLNNKDVRLNGDILVMAEMSDGSIIDLMAFYSDEAGMYFTARDFLGLTKAQCRQVWTEADMRYLRS